MSNQNTSNQTVDTAIANTAIHDCDDSTYEVHVSAATQHMLAQLRENFITGLNIYSLIESTMLKYAESHATKDYLLVKSSQAYKQLSESTNKELVELRQLVEVLKKENEELRNELNTLRDESEEYVLKEARNVNHSSEHSAYITDEDMKRIREGAIESIKRSKDIIGSAVNGGDRSLLGHTHPDSIDADNDPVENEPILVTAPDIEHSSENTVTLSDEDVKSIRGNGIVEIGNAVVKAIPTVKYSADEVKPNDVLSSHVHHNPNGAGNGVFVSTGKPDNGAEKIRVTEYSKVANTRI